MEVKFKKVTPDLMVLDVDKAVRFYTEKLGFKLDMLVLENEQAIETSLVDGKEYVYAMVSRGEVFVMFMRRDVYAEDVPPLKGVPIGASATFYFDVDDVHGLYGSFREKGVEIVKDLLTTWYGMTEFYIRDQDGYILGFAQRA